MIALSADLEEWVKTRATSASVIEVSAPSLPDAMARLMEHLQSRIEPSPAVIEVKIKLRLGEGKAGNVRPIAGVSSFGEAKVQGQPSVLGSGSPEVSPARTAVQSF